MISGIILAGGEPKRMGVDKRHLLLGKESLLSIAIEKMRRVADEILVVLAHGERRGKRPIAPTEVRILSDVEKGKGPLIGLVTGLQKMRYPFGLVIPCDLPFLPLRFLGFLVGAIHESPLRRPIIVSRWGGRIYPFPGIYSKSIVPKLMAWKKGGDLSISHFLERGSIEVRWIEEKEISSFDSPEISFFNVNTLIDLKTAQDLLEERVAIHKRLFQFFVEGGREWLRPRRVNTQNHQRPIRTL